MFLKESFCGLRFFRIVKPVYILGSAWSIANYTPYSTCFCFSSFVCASSLPLSLLSSL